MSVLWIEGSFLVCGPGNMQSLQRARRPLSAGILTSCICWTNTVYLWALAFVTCKTEIEKLWNFRAERHCRGHFVQEAINSKTFLTWEDSVNMWNRGIKTEGHGLSCGTLPLVELRLKNRRTCVWAEWEAQFDLWVSSVQTHTWFLSSPVTGL